MYDLAAKPHTQILYNKYDRWASYKSCKADFHKTRQDSFIYIVTYVHEHNTVSWSTNYVLTKSDVFTGKS